MKRLIFLVTATLLIIVANISCNNDTVDKKEREQESIYNEIEIRTKRKVISVDTTKHDSFARQKLLMKLTENYNIFFNGVKLALDYELNKGFEIIHFLRDDRYECHYICPNIYAQLTSTEYKNLKKRFRKMAWGKYVDDVIDSEGTKYQRTIIYTVNGVTIFLETNEKGCKEDISLYIDAYSQTITFHHHHHYICQYEYDKYIYEDVWWSEHNM